MHKVSLHPDILSVFGLVVIKAIPLVPGMDKGVFLAV